MPRAKDVRSECPLMLILVWVFLHTAKRLSFFRPEQRWWRNVKQKYKTMSIMYQANKEDLSLSPPSEAVATQWSGRVISKCNTEQVEQRSAVQLTTTGHCRTSESHETSSQGTTKHKVNTNVSRGPCAANRWRLRECERVGSLYTSTTLTFFSWHLL